MNTVSEMPLLKPPFSSPLRSLSVMGGSCSDRRSVLYLEGSLLSPVDGKLRHSVRALLRRGQKVIVLDMSRVPRIDAGGVGELIRTYNMATESDGVLQIARATGLVREILHRVGLFGILSQG